VQPHPGGEAVDERLQPSRLGSPPRGAPNWNWSVPGSGLSTMPFRGSGSLPNQWTCSRSSPSAATSPSSIRMLSSVTPGNGTRSVLRTVLRPPSAPTSHAACTVSPVVIVAVTPSSSWVNPTRPTPNSTLTPSSASRSRRMPSVCDWPSITGFGYGTSGVGSTIGKVAPSRTSWPLT